MDLVQLKQNREKIYGSKKKAIKLTGTYWY